MHACHLEQAGWMRADAVQVFNDEEALAIP